MVSTHLSSLVLSSIIMGYHGISCITPNDVHLKVHIKTGTAPQWLPSTGDSRRIWIWWDAHLVLPRMVNVNIKSPKVG